MSGTIVLETKVIGKIRGSSLRIVSKAEGAFESLAREAYLRRFPGSHAYETHLWISQTYPYQIQLITDWFREN